MREPHYLGIDLHRRRFTCCVRLESGRNYLSTWNLEQLPQFVKKLRPSDEIAVEVTGNTRLFYEAVRPHVARVVVVDPNQFQVISHSVKKTDPNDARSLALYLAKGLLPEVRMKEKAQAEVASLTQTRDRLVICDRGQPEARGLLTVMSRLRPFHLNVVLHFVDGLLSSGAACFDGGTSRLKNSRTSSRRSDSVLHICVASACFRWAS